MISSAYMYLSLPHFASFCFSRLSLPPSAFACLSSCLFEPLFASPCFSFPLTPSVCLSLATFASLRLPLSIPLPLFRMLLLVLVRYTEHLDVPIYKFPVTIAIAFRTHEVQTMSRPISAFQSSMKHQVRQNRRHKSTTYMHCSYIDQAPKAFMSLPCHLSSSATFT